MNKTFIKSRITLFLFVIIIILPLQLKAGTILFSDIDTLNVNPQTIPFKSIQFETSYMYSLLNLEKDENIAKILIRSSVYKQIELQLGSNTYIDSGSTIKEEAVLGLKVNLLKAHNSFSLWNPGISLLFHSNFFALGEDNEYSPGASLAFSWYILKSTKIEGSFRYTYFTSKDDKYLQFAGGGNIKLYFLNFVLFTEYYAQKKEIQNSKVSHFVQGGFRIFITREFLLFLRAGIELREIELSKDAKNAFFSFGTSSVWRNFY